MLLFERALFGTSLLWISKLKRVSIAIAERLLVILINIDDSFVFFSKNQSKTSAAARPSPILTTGPVIVTSKLSESST